MGYALASNARVGRRGPQIRPESCFQAPSLPSDWQLRRSIVRFEFGRGRRFIFFPIAGYPERGKRG